MFKVKGNFLREAQWDIPPDVPFPPGSTKTAVIQYYSSQGMSVKAIAQKLGFPYQQVYGAVQKMATAGTTVTHASAAEKKAFQDVLNATAPAFDGIGNDISQAKGAVAQDGWLAARDALGITCGIPQEERLNNTELKSTYERWVKSWVSTSTSSEVASGLVGLNRSLGKDDFNSFTDQLVAYWNQVQHKITGKEPAFGLKYSAGAYNSYRMANQYLSSDLRDDIAKAYNALPKKTLYRGINGAEEQLFNGVDAGDYVSLKPLVSSSTDKVMAYKFGHTVLQFEGVNGDQVFASDRLNATLFSTHQMERETVLFGNMVPWRVQRVEMIEGHRVIFLKVDTKAIQTGANAAVKMTQGIAKAEALSPDEAAQAKAMSQQYMTTDQIAAKLGKPSKAVYDYLHHGIMQLDTDVAAPVIKQSSLGNFDALTNTYSHYKYELTPTGGIKVWDTTGIHAQIVTYSSSQVVDFMTSSKVYNQDFHDLLTHAFPNVVPKVVSVIGKTVGSYTLQTNAIGDYKFTVDAGGNVFIKPIGLLPQKLNQGYIDKIKQEAIAGNWISPKGKAILKAFNVNTSPINKFGKFEYSILPSGQISVLDTETVGAPTATFTKKELEKLGNKSSLLSNYKDLYQHIFPDETPKIETPKVEPPKTEISVPGFAEIGGVKAKVVGKAVLITKKDGSQVKYATSSNYIKGVIANKDQFWKVGNQGLAVLKAMGLHESFREAESLAPVMTNLCGNIPNYVLSKIAGEAKQWAFLEMAGERQVFEGALMTGIENGWTRKQLSGVIQQVFSDGVHRIDPITGKVKSAIATESWAKTVARTELNRAFSSGEMTMYEYAGVKKIEWTAAGDENTCDECDAADGEIVNLGELFPGVDVDAPPGHPNCECAIMASDEDLISKRSNPEDIAWASRGGRTAEEYEQQFVFKHRVDQ